MTRRWMSKGPASDLTLAALLDRLRDDAAYMASGHVPRSVDDTRAIGVELCELIGRVEELIEAQPETPMARQDREWRDDRQVQRGTGPVEWKVDPSKRP